MHWRTYAFIYRRRNEGVPIDYIKKGSKRKIFGKGNMDRDANISAYQIIV